MNQLKLRADFYRALFSLCINDEKGLGHEQINKPMEANELIQDIRLKDFFTDKKNQEVVLVGFEGYVDYDGQISTLRPLVLEKRWVEV